MQVKYARIVPSSEAPGPSLSGEVARAFQRIRERAYEIYDNRPPDQGGSDYEDWLQAERELYVVPHSEIEDQPPAGRLCVHLDAEVLAERPITILAEPMQITVFGHSRANGELSLFRVVSLPEPIEPSQAALEAAAGRGIDIVLAKAGSVLEPVAPKPKAMAAAASAGDREAVVA